MNEIVDYHQGDTDNDADDDSIGEQQQLLSKHSDHNPCQATLEAYGSAERVSSSGKDAVVTAKDADTSPMVPADIGTQTSQQPLNI